MEMLDPNNPQPGVYYDVPMSEYRKVQALNHSTLQHIRRSPAHCLYAAENPRDTSKSQALGSALHVWALQRDLWDKEVAVIPDWPARSNDDKARWAKWEGDNAGLIQITKEQAAMVPEMSRAIGAHERASFYRGKKGRAEVVIVWNDPAGVLCKGRIDKAIEAAGGWMRVDIKTTRQTSPALFAKDCVTFGYHTQDAFYRRGLQVLGIKDLGERIISIETNPPHAVAVYHFGKDTRRTADQLITAWLSQFVYCQKNNDWPNLNEPEQEIDVPAWALLPDDEEEDQQEERKWTPITAS